MALVFGIYFTTEMHYTTRYISGGERTEAQGFQISYSSTKKHSDTIGPRPFIHLYISTKIHSVSWNILLLKMNIYVHFVI